MARSLQMSASVLAWTCLIASTAPLLFLLVMSRGWISEGTGTVFSTTNGDVTHDGWGLTYRGAWGSMLLWGQLLSVIAAMWLAARGGACVQRIAMIVLLAWMSLLAVNAWWVWLASEWSMMTVPALFTTFGVAVVIAWTALRWRHPPTIA